MRKSREVGPSLGSEKLQREFYRKDIASNLVIEATSAMPWRVKITTLSNDILRRMRNCSRDLPLERRATHLNQAMEKMQLELIRRNYYDPKAAVLLKQHKLEIWPGYVTSIRQHEEQILLCCEISCKVLRTDTVLEQIEEIYKRTNDNLTST